MPDTTYWRPTMFRGRSYESRNSISDATISTRDRDNIKLFRGRSTESLSSSTKPKTTIYLRRSYSSKVNDETATLQELIADRQWQRAINLIRGKGRLAQKKFKVPAFMHEWKGEAEIYPIHQACSSPTVPLELIDTLLFAYPDGINKTESNMKRNCLHIAVRAGVADEIIEYFLSEYPSLVYKSDEEGRIPLHYAISNGCSNEIVRKMVSICPRSICAPDVRGWTPMHVAVGRETDPDIIRFMVSACPEAVLLRTNAGSTLSKVMNLSPTSFSDLYSHIITEAQCEISNSASYKGYRRRTIKMIPISENYV